MTARVFLQDRFRETFDWQALRGRVGRLDWYVMLTAPRYEFRCWLMVDRMGFDAFVPSEQFWRKRNRYHKRKGLVDNPLMPRYLFAGFEAGSVPPWFHLLGIEAVQGVIGVDGTPQRAPREAVGRLIELGGANHFRAPDYQKWMRSRAEYNVGDQVEIVEGPFTGHRTKVREISENCALVLLNLFNCQQEASIALDSLELIR